MACPNLDGCPLHPHFTMRSSLRIWKDFFCNTNYQACVRYQAAQKGERVPPNLLPNGKLLEIML
jgi:hypothetical protein